jgi:hypothetical protein
VGDINDPGLLTPSQTSLLTDQYELTMAASYLRRGIDRPGASGRSRPGWGRP